MSVKAQLGDGEGDKVHSTINGIDEKLLAAYADEIFEEQGKIDEIMAAAQIKAQAHRDNIKAIKKTAAEKGIAKEPFAAKLRQIRKLKEADGCRESLNEDQRDLYDEIDLKLPVSRFFDSVPEFLKPAKE